LVEGEEEEELHRLELVVVLVVVDIKQQLFH
jgi:hypothetical protein